MERLGGPPAQLAPNCVIAIDSDRGQHQSIYYGVYAPDPSSKEIQKYPQSICEGRPRLERLASDVDGGRASPWWPWFRMLNRQPGVLIVRGPPLYWSLQMQMSQITKVFRS